MTEKSANLKIDGQKLHNLKNRKKNSGKMKRSLVTCRIIMEGPIFVQLESEKERNV